MGIVTMGFDVRLANRPPAPDSTLGSEYGKPLPFIWHLVHIDTVWVTFEGEGHGSKFTVT